MNSVKAGITLQKPKIYQYQETGHTSNTKYIDATNPQIWAIVESKLWKLMNIVVPLMKPRNSHIISTNVRDKAMKSSTSTCLYSSVVKVVGKEFSTLAFLDNKIMIAITNWETRAKKRAGTRYEIVFMIVSFVSLRVLLSWRSLPVLSTQLCLNLEWA